jgi:ubiquitin-conjugating enzyme E2 S
LIDPNPTSALNEEAGKLLLEDYPAYSSHARLFTEVHALRPKPPIASTKATLNKASESNQDNSKRSASGSNSTPLTSSQLQNTLPSDADKKPKILLFGIGVKRSEEEDGENRPAKRTQAIRRAGKGDLRRL